VLRCCGGEVAELAGVGGGDVEGHPSIDIPSRRSLNAE
jgi:hypothetical protein